MGETGAAACTTTGKNLAAVGGGHSLAEAVLLGALALLGLIGTEHCMTPPFRKISGDGAKPPLLLDSRGPVFPAAVDMVNA